MSAVVCVATPDSVYIMSDGLACTEDGKKVCGNFQKFEVINPTLCIGFTGTREFAQAVMKNFRSLCEDLESCTAEKASAYLIAISESLKKNTSLSAQFVVAGKSADGKVGMFAIKDDQSIQDLKPTAEEFKTAVLRPEDNESIPEFVPYIYAQIKKGVTPQSELFRRAMNSFIVDASKVENSINTNVFFHQFHLTE